MLGGESLRSAVTSHTTDANDRWGGRSLSEWLPEVVDGIVRNADPERVILFGSHARDETHADSDLDLLVVQATAPSQPRWRAEAALRAALPSAVPMDLFLVDAEEFDRKRDLLGTLVHTAVLEGVTVYERAD